MSDPVTSGLYGRRIQISGSASSKTSHTLIRYGHEVLTKIVPFILEAGGGITAAAGKEPLADTTSDNPPSIVFDWTVLEAVAGCFKENRYKWPRELGSPIVLVTSEKAVTEIPAHRATLWKSLLDSGLVRHERIQAGARSGAMIREKQADASDILLTIGGGAGIEHSARLYLSRRRPVIPLDLPIGSSREDGTGGSEKLYREAVEEPARFIQIQGSVDSAGAKLASLSTKKGAVPSSETATGLCKLLSDLARPVAFFVRLLNPERPPFLAVESFFRNVVDPVVKARGFSRTEVGTDKAREPFINVEIFSLLHHASLAIVDLTDLRPNCFMELGYALGRQHRVLITAQKGTSLPFDSSAIPCHFWRTDIDDAQRRQELSSFWTQQFERPPLVR